MFTDKDGSWKAVIELYLPLLLKRMIPEIILIEGAVKDIKIMNAAINFITPKNSSA